MSESPLKMQRRQKGEGSLYQRQDGYWYFKITINGLKKTESTGTKLEKKAKAEAVKIKRKLLGEFSRGEHKSRTASSVRVAELLDLYIEYLRKNCKSARDIEQVLNANVRRLFADRKAASITTADLEGYRAKRSAEGAMVATINRELSYMRSAFYRAKKKRTPPLVADVPYFPMQKENNIRTGFLEVEGYTRILNVLPMSLKLPFVLGYHLGCRKGELLSLKWEQVQFHDGFIELLKTKNGRDRNAPIYGVMDAWLYWQKRIRDEQSPHCEHVIFWHEADGIKAASPGEPIGAFYGHWETACKKAGHEGLLFHDLRRSAVRNMVQKIGIPESQAMLISGHETREMLLRYNIIDRKDLKEVGKKMAAWMRDQIGSIHPPV